MNILVNLFFFCVYFYVRLLAIEKLINHYTVADKLVDFLEATAPFGKPRFDTLLYPECHTFKNHVLITLSYLDQGANHSNVTLPGKLGNSQSQEQRDYPLLGCSQ